MYVCYIHSSAFHEGMQKSKFLSEPLTTIILQATIELWQVCPYIQTF